ncbi:MAG: M48 family metallopeptidase [Nitrospinae bacterium]|nr:M48 family metallopeptidase [Nitrospinota bacterium]
MDKEKTGTRQKNVRAAQAEGVCKRGEHGGAAGAVFLDWYKRRAASKIKERVEYWARLAGLRHGGIRINSAAKRWGSCGRNGGLNFSWRLVMAPHAALDYVVVHELSHLVHMNHSPDFWNTVRRIMPDYDAGRQWLKNNGHLLLV